MIISKPIAFAGLCSVAGVFFAAASPVPPPVEVASVEAVKPGPGGDKIDVPAGNPVQPGVTEVFKYTAGVPCENNYFYNCIDGKTFQQCEGNVWLEPQGIEDGFVCHAGEAKSLVKTPEGQVSPDEGVPPMGNPAPMPTETATAPPDVPETPTETPVETPAGTPVANSPGDTAIFPMGVPLQPDTTGGVKFHAGLTCSQQGTYNCIDGRNYQKCESGAWETPRQVNKGVICAVGMSTELVLTPGEQPSHLGLGGEKVEIPAGALLLPGVTEVFRYEPGTHCIENFAYNCYDLNSYQQCHDFRWDSGGAVSDDRICLMGETAGSVITSPKNLSPEEAKGEIVLPWISNPYVPGVTEARNYTWGTPCTNLGSWNCIDGKSYQSCSFGVWSLQETISGDLVCLAGESPEIKILPRRLAEELFPPPPKGTVSEGLPIPIPDGVPAAGGVTQGLKYRPGSGCSEDVSRMRGKNCVDGRIYQSCSDQQWGLFEDIEEGSVCTVGLSEDLALVPMRRVRRVAA